MIDNQLEALEPMDSNTNPKELFENKAIEVKTELTGEQVMIISRLKVMDKINEEKYKSKIVGHLITNFLELQVSKDRQSRKEYVNALQSKNDERSGGLLDRMSLNLGQK